VWGGGGKNGYSESWRNTANGVEATASMHNDALLILDELGQCDPAIAGEVAYLLANGMGKGRATKTGDSRMRSEWRLQYLSSGEIGLASLIQQTGRKIRAGQEIRMVDIPADAGCGFGILENLHGFESSQLLADTLRDNSKSFYGSAINEFIIKFLREKNSAIQNVKKHQQRFMVAHSILGASSEISRVASRMGFVAAAGELAIMLGIVPWPEGEAYRAASVCFSSWVNNRESVGPGDLTKALNQIRAFLLEHTPSRFPRINITDEIVEDSRGRRAGFCRALEAGSFEWFIFKDVFRNEVCKDYDYKQVEKILLSEGHLVVDSSGGSTPPRRLPGISKKTRVYVVRSTLLEDSVPDVPVVPVGGKDIVSGLLSRAIMEQRNIPELFQPVSTIKSSSMKEQEDTSTTNVVFPDIKL
jgi:uncharacterized protein (DUF927 family)